MSSCGSKRRPQFLRLGTLALAFAGWICAAIERYKRKAAMQEKRMSKMNVRRAGINAVAVLFVTLVAAPAQAGWANWWSKLWRRPAAPLHTVLAKNVTARVDWYRDKPTLAYGWATVPVGRDGTSRPVFLHHTEILGEGFRTLVAGELIRLDVTQDRRGRLVGENIQRLGQVATPTRR